ncbi:hypothetical protein LMH49_11175, partial [Neisseria gonorrhoeae]|uniref:hypothetical protein n=1 Tax=Neisseria gonorrhoeae TaxID=485 RepID=UPI001E3101C9
RAIAYAKRYSLDTFNETEFWSDFRSITRRLIAVYDFQRQGADPAAKGEEMASTQNAIDEVISPAKANFG